MPFRVTKLRAASAAAALLGAGAIVAASSLSAAAAPEPSPDQPGGAIRHSASGFGDAAALAR